jgi:membrane protease subunit (stomatin/prohibitin family)
MASMKMAGDLKNYALFQSAESITMAAQNSGGVAGAGVGMGAGVAIGQMMAGTLGSTQVAASSVSAEDPMETINKLHEMMKKGIITQAEFDSKKTELLKKVT